MSPSMRIYIKKWYYPLVVEEYEIPRYKSICILWGDDKKKSSAILSKITNGYRDQGISLDSKICARNLQFSI